MTTGVTSEWGDVGGPALSFHNSRRWSPLFFQDLWRKSVPKIVTLWPVLQEFPFTLSPCLLPLWGACIGSCVCFSDTALHLASQYFRCEGKMDKAVFCCGDGTEAGCKFTSELDNVGETWLLLRGRVKDLWKSREGIPCWFIEHHPFPLQSLNMFVLCQHGSGLL